MPKARSRGITAVRILGFSALAAGVLTATVAAFVTVAIARMIVTPPRKRDEDIRVLAVDRDRVTLSSTPDSRTPGTYGLWFNRGKGHARIGAILAEDETTVTREILAVDFGDLATATRARLNGWFFLRPRELGYPYRTVQLDLENGPGPAWLIPAATETESWVIQVHGRAVSRSEGLRAVPVFRAAGYTSLLISYRNDGDAAASADNRYALGETEWHDVDSAIEFAIANGAKNLVLMGWSMGGAMVLQAAAHSQHRELVRGIVLESPVIDWADVLHHQGAEMFVPAVIRRAVLAVISSPASKKLTGQSQRIDLARLNFVRRAGELKVPVLLIHSDDDGYVPVAASRALAAARTDIVTFEEFTIGRHAKLWNADPDRWNRAITEWLAKLPFSPTSGKAARRATGRTTRSIRQRATESE